MSVPVGQTVNHTTTVRAVYLEVRFVDWIIGNTAIARILGSTNPGVYSQNTCCGFKQQTKTYVRQFTGVAQGTTNLRIRARGGGDDPDYCETTVPVTVTAAAAGAPRVDLKINGSDGPLNVVPGSTMTFSWTSSNVTSCTANNIAGWVGTKPPNGSQTRTAASATWTLTCTGPGGTASDSVTTNASWNTITVNLTANPTTVGPNGSSTLSWSTFNATSCTASGGWSGSRPTSGTASTGPLSATRSFTLYCTNSFVGATDTATVTVSAGAPPPTAPPPGVPSVDLRINGGNGPLTVTSGSTATLSWSSANVTSCTSSGAWSGSRPTSGSAGTGSITSNRTYTITCTGPGGSRSDSVTVNVSAAPTPAPTTTPRPAAPTVDLRANGSPGSTTISSGSSATLSWTTTNATSCSSSGGWSGSRPTSGSTSTGALTATRTYNLTCTGPGGSASDSVTVNIGAAPPPPSVTVDLRANGSNGPITVASGSNVALSWSSTNANTCTSSGAWSGSRPTSGSFNATNITSNRTFTLTCNRTAGGSATDSVSVNVSGSPVLPNVNFTVNGSTGTVTVPSGSLVRSVWSSTNATSCTASASVATTNWSGSVGTSGTRNNCGPVTSNRTMTITCTGPGGSTSRSVNVNISGGAVPPTVDLRANGSAGSTTISSGSSATLSWTTTNATSCTASGGWSGARGISGSQSTGALLATRTYFLTCTGPGGSGSDSVTVNIGAGGACNPARPYDPGIPACSSTGSGPITWEWDAVAGVNQYDIDILNGSGVVVVSNGFQPAANFGCAGGGVCRYASTHPVGLQVRSRISTLGAACSASAPEFSPYTSVPACISSSCTVDLNPNILNVEVGQTATDGLVANVSVTGGASVSQVDFDSSDPAVCSVTAIDNTPPNWTTDVTGNTVGTSSVSATVTLDDGNTCTTGPGGGAQVNVTAPGPWWQVTGGEVISRGTISSLIPQSCAASPGCVDSLILNDAVSNRPATAIYNGNYDFSSGAGRGTVSASDEWLARTGTAPNIYSYEFFDDMARGKNFTNLTANAIITTNEIASAPEDGGYAWIGAAGNVSLGSPGGAPEVVINKKAVLFIDGNLTIYDSVLLNDITADFFMVVVSGNISVDPGLTSSSTDTPVIQGIFAANGTFSSGTNGTDDGILVVEGSVAASGFNLERDLAGENTDTPAEHFIYSPALISNYPSALSERHLVWREVAP